MEFPWLLGHMIWQSPSPCPGVTVTAVSQIRPPDQDAIRLCIWACVCVWLYVGAYVLIMVPLHGFCYKLITNHVKELAVQWFEQKISYSFTDVVQLFIIFNWTLSHKMCDVIRFALPRLCVMHVTNRWVVKPLPHASTGSRSKKGETANLSQMNFCTSAHWQPKHICPKSFNFSGELTHF